MCFVSSTPPSGDIEGLKSSMRNKVNFNSSLKTAEYYLGETGPIKIDLDQVLAIGELTTSAGPASDDYCLYLITPIFWHAIPMDAEGMEAFVKWLEVEFNTDLKTALANSVTEKSRMMYPEQLREKQFLQFADYQPKDWFDKLKVRLGLKPDKIYKLHPEVNEILVKMIEREQDPDQQK
jgi:hypothetical protein